MGSCFSRSRHSGGASPSGPKLLGPGKLDSSLLKESGGGGSLIGGVGGGPSAAGSAGVGPGGVSDGSTGVGVRNGPMPSIPNSGTGDGSVDGGLAGNSGVQGVGSGPSGNLAGQAHKDEWKKQNNVQRDLNENCHG
ncbi:hypothetical protein B566_EDAN011962 [Ephemera danica]|nr:hypothetical protein B566_EDAN011962 [Ephemera danica]